MKIKIKKRAVTLASLIACFMPFSPYAAQLNLNTNPNPPDFTSDQTFSGNTGSGTSGHGVFVSTLNTGNINLAGFQINSTGNLYGFNALTAGIINVTNGTVNASDNKNAAGTSGWGIFASGVNATNPNNILRSTINMTDILSLTANNNGVYGVDAEVGGAINISGTGVGSSFSAQGNKNMVAAGTWNNGFGVYANGANSANPDDIKQSTVEIKNFDTINTSGNGLYGTYANAGGVVTIQGASADSSFTSSGNRNKTGVDGGGNDTWTNGYGVYANNVNSANPDDIKHSTVSITNIKTFNTNQNGIYGIAAAAGGNVIIEGTSASGSILNSIGNINSAGTGGAGIFSTGANSSVSISGMQTVNLSQNGLYGIHSAAGGNITIEGTSDSSSAFNSIGNINSAGTGGAGIFSTGANSSVSINGMQTVNLSQNGLYGIHSAAGGNIIIEGTSDNNSIFNAIGNINLAGSNGAGIFSTGANSSVSISGMQTVNSAQNGMYGISATVGGSVTVEGTGTTTINLNENKKTDGTEDGVGLYITGAGTSVDISQIETFNANNNGKYGVYFYNSGATTTNIAGNGSLISSFNVNNNANIGLLYSNANHTVDFSGFKYYNFNGNGAAGFSMANSNSVLTITGVLSGSEINASGNGGAGFSTLATSAVILKNITKIETIGNAGSGIIIGSGVTFEDMDLGISLISTNNTGTSSDGISMNGTHNLLINELSANNNGRYGLAVIGGSTTFDMNDNAFHTYLNGNNGLYINASNLTLNNLSNIVSTDNGGDGITVTASGTLNLNGTTSGASLVVNDNVKMGINGLGSVVFNNITYFEAQRNGSTGLKFTANNQFTGVENGIGFWAEYNTGTGMEIAGTHTFDKLTQFSVNNNGIHGLHVITAGTNVSFDFDNHIMEVYGNGTHGVYVQGGALELKNIASGIFSNNGGSGITTSSAVTLNIEGDENGSVLLAENNGGHGLFFSGSGTLKNITKIIAKGNGNYGFYIGSNMTWDLDPLKEVSLIAIDNIKVSGSYNGMSISGVTINNVVEMIATDNGGRGASVGSGGVINVIGNADFSRNLDVGLGIGSGGIFNVTNSTSDNHYIVVSDITRTGATQALGIDVHGGRLNADNVNFVLKTQGGIGIINWYSGVSDISNSNFYTENNLNGILSSRGSAYISSDTGLHTFYGYNNILPIVVQEGGILSIDNMEIYLEENQYGLTANFGGGELTVTGNGSNRLVLKNNISHGLSVLFDTQRPNTPGIMTIDNMQIIAEGNDLAYINGDGSKEESITIRNSVINMLSDNNVFATENHGTYVIDNVQLFGGKLLLNNTGTGLSEFSAFGSTLAGGIKTSSNSVSNVLFKDSDWEMKTSSNITSLENDNSRISIRNPAAGIYNKLTVSNYTGTNAKIEMNTFFNSAGNNTDKLIINGETGGDTVLYVNGTGTDGTYSLNGIKVVDASNGATSEGNFSLYGGIFDKYGYEYELLRGDIEGIDKNSFYLRTAGVSSVARTAANVPALHLNIVHTGMNELRKRVGDLRYNRVHDDGLWVRSYTRHLNIDDTAESEMNLYGVEAGYDRQVTIFDKNIYLGLMAGYIDGDNIKTYQKNGRDSSSETQTPSFGFYGTWVDNKGWFVDGTARYFRANMDVTSHTSIGEIITYSPDRDFIALSLEAGRTFKKACTRYESGYIVEPKVEIRYAYSKSKTFNTNTDYDISYGETQSLVTRAGLLLGYDKVINDKMVLIPFIEMNVSQEWEGKTDVRYANTPLKSDLGGTTFGISGGLNANLNNNISMYSEITYEKGTIIEAIGGNIGFRYNF